MIHSGGNHFYFSQFSFKKWLVVQPTTCFHIAHMKWISFEFVYSLYCVLQFLIKLIRDWNETIIMSGLSGSAGTGAHTLMHAHTRTDFSHTTLNIMSAFVSITEDSDIMWTFISSRACVHMCMCICVYEREREGEGSREIVKLGHPPNPLTSTVASCSSLWPRAVVMSAWVTWCKQEGSCLFIGFLTIWLYLNTKLAQKTRYSK